MKGTCVVGWDHTQGPEGPLGHLCTRLNRSLDRIGTGIKDKVPCLVILPKANQKITLLRFCFNPSPWSSCTSIPLMKMELSMIQDKNNWSEHCKLNQKIKSDNHKFHLQLKPYHYNCQSFQLIHLLWNSVVMNKGDPSLKQYSSDMPLSRYGLLLERSVLLFSPSDPENAHTPAQHHLMFRHSTRGSEDCGPVKCLRVNRSVGALTLVVSLWWNQQSPILRTSRTSLDTFNGAHCNWTWPLVNS